ncbi:GGDEF domain-containing protein [Bowmanella yangjiangensis]|uniref:diguanylate cyclase n=1 Tax=Bowmanella yangjiangensis TaxID=2811230 RepID=A0ABS3CSE1_9ALTE|nr:GGDEF domain-containing protein [Bowmanella yangjiangensis]MBN7820037.1 GGDEF domain-containing protein [Bowmanella yangjiangensis]
MLQSVAFNLAILTIATLAFYLFIFVLPKQPKRHQHRALLCFQYSFVLSYLAYAGLCLRYLGFWGTSVLTVNLFLLAAFYLFYQGVRLRFNAPLNCRAGLLVVAHLVLFTLVQWWLWREGHWYGTRELLAFFNHSIPLLLTQQFLFVRRRAHNGGDRLMQLTLLLIWLMILVVMPIYAYAGQPLGGLLPIATLFALALECLLFAGVAMSYIHDLIAKLKDEAYTDNLTGLKNRRFFKRISAGVFSSAKRYQFSICVILADIDDFKTLNDEFGHAEGDMAIRLVADTLKSIVREEDVLVRFGGEEFLILTPNTQVEEAVRIAERMRANVAALEPKNTALCREISLSVGVSLVQDYADLELAIQRADKAMYEAKKGGKNRVVLAQAPEHTVAKNESKTALIKSAK